MKLFNVFNLFKEKIHEIHDSIFIKKDRVKFI